jgi:bifunctional DNase/RNase
MIPVTLYNVFSDAERGEAWLVLAEESGARGLPIFVGSDLKLVVMELFRKKPHPLKNPRPLTYSFFASILTAVGAELIEVQVLELVHNTFRAVAVVRAGGSEYRIDARPSDAVSLAACMNRPVYVAEALMAVAGKPLGAEGRPADLPQGFVSMRGLWPGTFAVESAENH